MSPLPTPLRIASVSGSVTDRRHAFAEIARNEDVQYIVGDWMSEYNMTMRGGAKSNPRSDSAEFETSFMEAIEPALEALARRHIKVAVNAGASDPEKLHDELTRLIKSQGLDLKVAWISGDEVLEQVQNAIQSGDPLVSLTTGMLFSINSCQIQVIIDIPFQEKRFPSGDSLPSMLNVTLAAGVSSRP